MIMTDHRLNNRLRALRKDDLGISSIVKFADLLGGEEAGWYHQKIQRLETGQTSLTDKDAAYIAKTLDIPIYALFVEPQTVISEADRALISHYHHADPETQEKILSLLKIL